MKEKVLVDLIRSLEMPFSFERSFRLSNSGISADRYLVSANNKVMNSKFESDCREVYREFGCPKALSDVIENGMAQAINLHWGVEHSEKNTVRKIYFEYPFDLNQSANSSSSPKLVYLGYKWSVADPSHVIETSYHRHPDLDPHALLSEVNKLCCDSTYAFTEELVRQADARNTYSEIQYIETSETTTQRHAFDINFYGTSLTLDECQSQLFAVANSFSCPATQLSCLLEQISVQELGHIAAGKHRNGKEFLTVYYGAEHWNQSKGSPNQVNREVLSSPTPFTWLKFTEPGDGYFDYCLWPYKPRKPVQGKLKASNLLYHSFELANLLPEASILLDALSRDFGDCKTVWGIKCRENTIEWEFYFYDYRRTERKVPAARLLSTISGNRRAPLFVNESIPYFMLSVDIGADLLRGLKEVDACHIYIGNPGSALSSGISYLVNSHDMRMKNLYCFFDPKTDLASVVQKITSSVHFLETQHNVQELLRPELVDCRTICVANKSSCDTVYFSGISIHQLIFALVWLKFPEELRVFIERYAEQLDHLTFDVGLDYTTKDGEIEVLNTGYYANF